MGTLPAVDARELGEIFDAFALKSESRYAEITRPWTLYNHVTKTFHGSNANDHTDDFRRRVSRAAEDEIQRSDGNTVAGMDYSSALLMLIKMPETRLVSSARDSVSAEIDGILWHELGHYLCPGGRGIQHDFYGQGGNKTPNECIAQSFSTVSLVQGNTPGPHPEATAWLSARALIVYGNRDYFYAPVIGAIPGLHARENIATLGAAETINLPCRLTHEFNGSERHNIELSRVFEPLRSPRISDGMLYMTDVLDGLPALMFADHGSLTDAVYSVSRMFIMPFLDRRTEITANGFSEGMARAEDPVYDLKGAHWHKVRADIAARDKIIAARVQPYAVETSDMRVLGYFDGPNRNAPIEPGSHDWGPVMRASAVYADLRAQQDAGAAEPGTEGLGHKELAQFARTRADAQTRQANARYGFHF